ncbi:MAG: 30S ribosomal protein S9 [Cytophagales bacterium]|nr:30S ribosomal protein S9 [Cytophagales bacterium]
MEVINTIGRRKTAVARIYVKQGTGVITVNKRSFEDYFPIETLRNIIKQPLEITNNTTNYDIKVNVDGGGISGQASAIRLAIARALCEINPENRAILKRGTTAVDKDGKPIKKENLLRRDPRMVERKKAGRRKARRRFQFSKR